MKYVKLRQNGFETTSLIVLTGVISVILATGFYVYKRSDNKQTANKQTSQNTPQAVNTLSSKPAPVPSAEPVTAPEPVVSQPALEPTAPTEPQPTPAPTSMATPFTSSHCNGNSVVYISNPAGAPVSYKPPGANWQTVKTYSYGEQVSIYCQPYDDPVLNEYALIDDAYVKKSDLSPTKP